MSAAPPPPNDDDPSALPARLLGAWPHQEEEYALLCLDLDGRIVGATGGIQKVLGYEASGLVGQPVSLLFTEEDLQRRLDRHERGVARSRGISEDDRWHVRRDGSRIWIGGTITAVKDDEGRCIGFVKVMRDRTDLRAQIQSLENRVAGLRATIEHKDRHLTTLAHELANPLSPLMQACHMLGQANEAQTTKLRDVIARQLDTLKQLIGDVRAAASSRREQPELIWQRFQLQELLGQAVQACEAQADAHGLTLQLLAPEAPIWLEADASRLHQVVLNLLSNAIKYTPAGGHVWLTASVEDPHAVIRVEDDGVGIAPEMLPRIFDLFTQEPSSRHLSEGGMGVGLSMVKQWVDLHGGVVEVRSDGRGKGSSFAVRLPLQR